MIELNYLLLYVSLLQVLTKKNGSLWHHLFHHYLNTCQWNFTNVYSNEICLRDKKQLLKYQLNNWAGCCTSVGLKLVVWYLLLENKNNNEKKSYLSRGLGWKWIHAKFWCTRFSNCIMQVLVMLNTNWWIPSQITTYLGKRDFVDHIEHIDPVGKSSLANNVVLYKRHCNQLELDKTVALFSRVNEN